MNKKHLAMLGLCFMMASALTNVAPTYGAPPEGKHCRPKNSMYNITHQLHESKVLSDTDVERIHEYLRSPEAFNIRLEAMVTAKVITPEQAKQYKAKYAEVNTQQVKEKHH